MLSTSLLLALVVGTWNGQWFPSGRAEHRAHVAVEKATIETAGRILSEGISKADPSGSDDLILCLNEIRDMESAEALCRAIGRTNLSVVVISAYRRRDRFDQQQDVIMTTLPVAKASWSRWKSWKDCMPPRGYAHADIVVAPAVTASVYSVHLKSNYGQNTDAEAKSNRLKRGRAIVQIVDQERPKRRKTRGPVIIAGDFNADRFSSKSKEETLFASLASAGFTDTFEGEDASVCITHPSRNKRYPGSVLDYIFVREFEKASKNVIYPSHGISDHDAVFVRLETSSYR